MADAGDEVCDVAGAVEGGDGLTVGVGAGFAGCVFVFLFLEGFAISLVVGLNAFVDGSGAGVLDVEWVGAGVSGGGYGLGLAAG